jgi:hypothetical protein
MVRPKRLESLLEMLMNYAQAFTMLSADIEKVRAQILIEANQSNLAVLGIEMPKMAELQARIQDLLATCRQAPQLDRLMGPIGRFLAQLEAGTNPSALHHAVDHLQLQMFDELDRLRLYHVPEAMVPLYENELPFGEQVFDRFPSAVPDSRNAGRCLALGQPTACMFHLMRVMERGLAAYAAKLGIPYASSWEAYTRQLESQFKVEWAKKEKAWKKVEPFHKQILGDIIGIKTAWRNPTVHIVSDYTEAEALRAYFAVAGFMNNLAKKVREGGRRKAKRVAS